jgi:hypothetical protein
MPAQTYDRTQQEITGTPNRTATTPAPVAAPKPVQAAAVKPDPRDAIAAAEKQAALVAAQQAAQREAQVKAAADAFAKQQQAQQAALAAQIAGTAKSNLDQRSDISMLRSAALGEGPSAAALQAQQSGQAIAAQQYALAASRGANPAAMRAAILQGGQAQQAAAGQAAMARASEQMAAQQNYANAYAGGVGQQLNAAGLNSTTGLGVLNANQQVANMGQQGQQYSNTALLQALQNQYGMQHDVETMNVQQAIAKMQTENQMNISQAQINSQPSFWERMFGNVIQGGAGGVAKVLLS